MERRMALPIAVRRAGTRLSIALSSKRTSVVGGWINSAKPANATIPTCLPDVLFRTNDSAASLATINRLGGISVEHILRETSIAMITVALLEGTSTVATGRPNANTRLASANRNRRKGRCFRSQDCFAAASRTRERLEYRTAKRRRRRKTHRYIRIASGINKNR